MSISVMKQALEALEWNYGTDLENIENCTAWLDKLNATIPALRQAIAEAERHVSYVCPNCHWSLDKQVRTHTPEDIKKIESKWVGLTDEEIKEIVGPWGPTAIKGYTRKLFDQIEAKLKEKNNGN